MHLKMLAVAALEMRYGYAHSRLGKLWNRSQFGSSNANRVASVFGSSWWGRRRVYRLHDIAPMRSLARDRRDGGGSSVRECIDGMPLKGLRQCTGRIEILRQQGDILINRFRIGAA